LQGTGIPSSRGQTLHRAEGVVTLLPERSDKGNTPKKAEIISIRPFHNNTLRIFSKVFYVTCTRRGDAARLRITCGRLDRALMACVPPASSINAAIASPHRPSAAVVIIL
jgi:hypothetical protein